VARYWGPVSGRGRGAWALHHATVTATSDALERRLAASCSRRHAAAGYKTDRGARRPAGRVAAATDDSVSQLASRIKGAGEAVSGELVCHALMERRSWMTPLLVAFQKEPGCDPCGF